MQNEFIWALIKVSVVLVSSLFVLLVLAWIAAKKCFPNVQKSPEESSPVTQLPTKDKSIAA
jgi:vancomycin permeability regulator SanA